MLENRTISVLFLLITSWLGVYINTSVRPSGLADPLQNLFLTLIISKGMVQLINVSNVHTKGILLKSSGFAV